MPATPPSPSDPAAAEQIRALRLSGRLNAALQLASGVLDAEPANWPVMGEIIQVLVCLEQAASAARFYQVFTGDPAQGNELPPAALVRLAMQLERRDLLAGMAPPPAPSWLASLLGEGVDPVPGLDIAQVALRVDNGHPVFTFAGSCPHCAHGQRQEFRLTLVSRRQWVCPGCFGLMHLDQQVTGPALRQAFREQLDQGMFAADQRLIRQVRPGMTGLTEVPPVVAALGQEYHFLLNELALRLVEGRS